MTTAYCPRRLMFLAGLGMTAWGYATGAYADTAWTGSIGAGGVWKPDYLGSDDYEFRGFPNLTLQAKGVGYLSLKDGIGTYLTESDHWQTSIFLTYLFGRDNTGDLSDFEEVDGGIAGGLRLGYNQGAWQHNLSIKAPIGGDLEGYRVDVSTRWKTALSQRWSFFIQPGIGYADKQWNQAYFDVSAEDSAASGVRAYRVSDGSWDAHFTTGVNFQITKEWRLSMAGRVSRLTGDAEDSPIVDELGDATQGSLMIGTAYSF
ncbi:MipA/OmpV family protein [Terasakiispira papahanaumokuakeensis]|nr:MipA/OmpV family protein [Terasakiispira papahanaumokuakeensis]